MDINIDNIDIIEEIIQYTTKPTVMSFSVIGYFSMIYGLIRYMKNREPYSLKVPMLFYNNAQIALNIYMVYGLSAVISYPNIYGINIPYTRDLRYYVYIHYLSKYFDYFDTLFIILRGKEKQQLSYLHVYHHSTIGVIWGFLLYRGHGNGTAAFGCFINSVIHLIMYSHYLCTSLGYRNPFKKYITRTQLLQFAVCLLHSLIVICVEDIVPRRYALIELVYQTSMLALFSNFYIKSYSLPNTKRI
uniref:Very-long-chain 3-oxoacyl-CoA synthase n=1 Tax=viral metagenome TaxID=1070528 RepID=A0A6C0LH29_9ZZZZ